MPYLLKFSSEIKSTSFLNSSRSMEGSEKREFHESHCSPNSSISRFFQNIYHKNGVDSFLLVLPVLFGSFPSNCIKNCRTAQNPTSAISIDLFSVVFRQKAAPNRKKIQIGRGRRYINYYLANQSFLAANCFWSQSLPSTKRETM